MVQFKDEKAQEDPVAVEEAREAQGGRGGGDCPYLVGDAVPGPEEGSVGAWHVVKESNWGPGPGARQVEGSSDNCQLSNWEKELPSSDVRVAVSGTGLNRGGVIFWTC